MLRIIAIALALVVNPSLTSAQPLTDADRLNNTFTECLNQVNRNTHNVLVLDTLAGKYLTEICALKNHSQKCVKARKELAAAAVAAMPQSPSWPYGN